MTEATIRGLIQGGAFLFLGLLATLIWKLLRSKSEGARRLKWVLGASAALVVTAVIIHDNGLPTALVIAAIIGAIVWIIKGFKKSS